MKLSGEPFLSTGMGFHRVNLWDLYPFLGGAWVILQELNFCTAKQLLKNSHKRSHGENRVSASYHAGLILDIQKKFAHQKLLLQHPLYRISVKVSILYFNIVIFKKITTFFNLKDIFSSYEHHRQLQNI